MRPFWIGVVLALLVTACAHSRVPKPPSSSTHGVTVNPANIKRVVRELPPNYEVTTGIPSAASPRVIWGLGADAAEMRVRPAQCASLADPGNGRDQSAQGLSGSGAGGIIDARSLRMMRSEVSGCSVACATSKLASDRSPALPRSLWQPAQ